MASVSKRMGRDRQKALDSFNTAMDSAIAKMDEIRDWSYSMMMAARACKERAIGLPIGMLPSEKEAQNG